VILVPVVRLAALKFSDAFVQLADYHLGIAVARDRKVVVADVAVVRVLIE